MLPTKNCWSTQWYENKSDLLAKHNWQSFKNIEKSVFHQDKQPILEWQTVSGDILQIKSTHLDKLRMLTEKSNKSFQIRAFNIVTNAPYCDSFNSEEQWTACSTSEHS